MNPTAHYLLMTLLWSSSLLLTSCSTSRYLSGEFQAPSPPDYTRSDHWASLPDKADNADLVPVETLTNGQQEAEVDVFFIHPTSYSKGELWNADVNDAKVNKKTDVGTMKYQASVFNGSCRIYAPRYRQAMIKAFLPTPKKIPMSIKHLNWHIVMLKVLLTFT